MFYYMKVRSFVLMILLVFPIIALAQNFVHGKVIDSETKKGLPYANLIYLNIKSAYYTDSLGNYNIPVLNDDLQISCIGYEKQILKSLPEDKVIEVKPVQYTLNQVVINFRSAKVIRLGFFKDKVYTSNLFPMGLLGPQGLSKNYVAQYIASKGEDLIITKLLYNLSNHSTSSHLIFDDGRIKACETTNLRVHLFSVNKITGLPDKELLTQNLVFKNNCDLGNLVVDVSDEHIIMPKNGVFVSLEYIDIQHKSNTPYFPLLVVNYRGKKLNSTYGSYHQDEWVDFWHIAGKPVQFGIEVAK